MEGRWVDHYWEEWDKWLQEEGQTWSQVKRASYQEKVNYCAACPKRYTHPSMADMLQNEGEYDHEPDDPLSRLVLENETTS